MRTLNLWSMKALRANRSLFAAICVVSFLSLGVGRQQSLLAQEEDKGPVSATITLERIEHDSVKQIVATVVKDDGSPAANAELKFFVKRHFGMLPIGPDVNSTDDQGKVSVDFPNDLPADTAGFVTIVASIEDSEAYEDTSTDIKAQWGLATHLSTDRNERALWSARANAPLALILGVNGMLAAVWCTILYIIVQLFKIKRIGKV